MNILNFPSQVFSGDTLKFTDDANGYPASDGWIMAYTVMDAANKYKIVSTPDGDSHYFEVPPEVSRLWIPGTYTANAFVSDAGETERYTIGTKRVEISPDPLAGAKDTRSYVEKMLEGVEAMLLGKASEDQKQLMIGGRSLLRYDFSDLFDIRDRLRGELKSLEAEARLAAGLGSGNKIKVRF